jgi:hypothetical protein
MSYRFFWLLASKQSAKPSYAPVCWKHNANTKSFLVATARTREGTFWSSRLTPVKHEIRNIIIIDAVGSRVVPSEVCPSIFSSGFLCFSPVLVLGVRNISSITQSIRPNCIRFIFYVPNTVIVATVLFLASSSNEPYQFFRTGYWGTCNTITTLLKVESRTTGLPQCKH